MWFEPLPAVELARRLRQIPLFGSASVDELFRIAGIGRQVRHEKGQILFEEGSLAEQIQFLLEGKVHLKARSGEAREVEPPALLGFREVLEGSSMRETARASAGAICLSLAAEDFRTLLSDNVELAQGLFRMLFGNPPPKSPPVVLKGAANPEMARLAAHGPPGLKPIQKVLILQDIPIFSRATAEELLELASIARELPLAESSLLFGEFDPPSLFVLLAGQLSLELPEGSEPLLAGPGDAVGVYETLAGVPFGRRAHVARPGAALRLDREEVFDLLADRVELLQGLFSALFESGAFAGWRPGERRPG